MALRIVRLGTPRHPQEGTRIGTVRRPPRGVRKDRYAADDWYDVWYPELSPSPTLVSQAQAARTEAEWRAFARAFRAEMKQPAASRTLDLLAALSHHADFSVGCYCENEARCHRAVLRELLAERGAKMGSRRRKSAMDLLGGTARRRRRSRRQIDRQA
jgi:uncharacterized protein YeaO (DUF488 family)